MDLDMGKTLNDHTIIILLINVQLNEMQVI
jgi:hypothetical protein